ncbi:hypothetical protein EZV62_004732 [Acer yangbiense]|uniref:Aspartate/glutamate/uridylate kinase domain-containing protein n=1 Tax=Acer yangbiense TaxID=1000413 RepID=A0A5C7IK73_9ROSI|nr:hypothetical protein EZV62_004732 [Acer yangbiense]
MRKPFGHLQPGRELQYGQVSAAELVQAVYEMLSAAGISMDVEKQSLMQKTYKNSCRSHEQHFCLSRSLCLIEKRLVDGTGKFQGPGLVAILEGVSLNREEISSLQLLPPWRLRGDTLNYGLGLLSRYFICDFLSIISGGYFYMFDPHATRSLLVCARLAEGEGLEELNSDLKTSIVDIGRFIPFVPTLRLSVQLLAHISFMTQSALLSPNSNIDFSQGSLDRGPSLAKVDSRSCSRQSQSCFPIWLFGIMHFAFQFIQLSIITHIGVGTNLTERFRDQFNPMLIGENMPWSSLDSTVICMPMSSECLKDGLEVGLKRVKQIVDRYLEHASRTLIFLKSVLKVKLILSNNDIACILSNAVIKLNVIDVNLYQDGTRFVDKWLVGLSLGSGQTRNMALDRRYLAYNLTPVAGVAALIFRDGHPVDALGTSSIMSPLPLSNWECLTEQVIWPFYARLVDLPVWQLYSGNLVKAEEGMFLSQPGFGVGGNVLPASVCSFVKEHYQVFSVPWELVTEIKSAGFRDLLISVEMMRQVARLTNVHSSHGLSAQTAVSSCNALEMVTSLGKALLDFGRGVDEDTGWAGGPVLQGNTIAGSSNRYEDPKLLSIVAESLAMPNSNKPFSELGESCDGIKPGSMVFMGKFTKFWWGRRPILCRVRDRHLLFIPPALTNPIPRNSTTDVDATGSDVIGSSINQTSESELFQPYIAAFEVAKEKYPWLLSLLNQYNIPIFDTAFMNCVLPHAIDELFIFFAHDFVSNGSEYGSEELEVLRSLPIFRTVIGSFTNLVGQGQCIISSNSFLKPSDEHCLSYSADSSVVETLKDTKFVRNADEFSMDLSKPKDLFDPADAILTPVFSGERKKFPGEMFDTDGWLQILRKAGLRNSIEADIILECARRVEFLGNECLKSQVDLDDFETDLLRSDNEISMEIWALAGSIIEAVFSKFAVHYGGNCCNQLGMITFVPAELGLPNVCGKRVLTAYSEAIISKDWPPAWSCAPIISGQSFVPPEYCWSALQLRSPPTFSTVLKHLQILKDLGLQDMLSVASSKNLLLNLQKACGYQHLNPNEHHAVMEILLFVSDGTVEANMSDGFDWALDAIVPDDGSRDIEATSASLVGKEILAKDALQVQFHPLRPFYKGEIVAWRIQNGEKKLKYGRVPDDVRPSGFSCMLMGDEASTATIPEDINSVTDTKSHDEIPENSRRGKTMTSQVGEKAVSCGVINASCIEELNFIKELHLSYDCYLCVWNFAAHLEELEQLLKGIAMMKELTPRTRDYLVSFGECMSTRIFAAYLNRVGVKTRQYDAFDIGFITTIDFTNVDILEATYPAVAKRLHGDWISDPAIPVVTGFLGKGWRCCAITTLDRGGSDLTATTTGKALGLEEIQVWKDVDGVLTCDPNIYQRAEPVPYLTFDEAAELAYFGAAMVHESAPALLDYMIENIEIESFIYRHGIMTHGEDMKIEDSNIRILVLAWKLKAAKLGYFTQVRS